MVLNQQHFSLRKLDSRIKIAIMAVNFPEENSDEEED